MNLILMMYACLISGSLINTLNVILWPISIYTELMLLFCINIYMFTRLVYIKHSFSPHNMLGNTEPCLNNHNVYVCVRMCV